MGVDIYLKSIFDPFIKQRRHAMDEDLVKEDFNHAIELMYETYRSSGGYFRNGYNDGDVMWAMGLSWVDTVHPMLDVERCLPIERARELIAMIEARPLTQERLERHYFENMTRGSHQHPNMIEQVAAEDGDDSQPPLLPPDFEVMARHLRERREQLLAILRKSVELDEPLSCSL